MFAALCISPPAAAVAATDVRADHVIRVNVPDGSHAGPGEGDHMQPPTYARKDEVVEFRVRSQRKGGLAVHGLSNLVKIESGTESIVRLKAIYTGRFPLHFHGNDGSHFEIAVLEIRE
jgi:hypothetical protein